MPFFENSLDAEFEHLKKQLRINDDEKKFRLAVAVDKENGKIVVDLGRRTSRFEMDKKLALNFIAMLQRQVNEIE